MEVRETNLIKYIRMETKFAICDKLWFFNATEEKIESAVVQGIRIMATDVHADEKGDDVLDASVVLYDMKNRMVLTEREVFASEDECREHYRHVFEVA